MIPDIVNPTDLPEYRVKHWAFMVQWWSGQVFEHIRNDAKRAHAERQLASAQALLT